MWRGPLGGPNWRDDGSVEGKNIRRQNPERSRSRSGFSSPHQRSGRLVFLITRSLPHRGGDHGSDLVDHPLASGVGKVGVALGHLGRALPEEILHFVQRLAPALTARLANEWRRSWMRRCSTPATASTRQKVLCGVLSGLSPERPGKTQGEVPRR